MRQYQGRGVRKITPHVFLPQVECHKEALWGEGKQPEKVCPPGLTKPVAPIAVPLTASTFHNGLSSCLYPP